MFDLSRLGAWGDLPFFKDTLPGIVMALEAEERAVFPPADAVFNALERTQPENTNVVLLGQDPYHTKGKADGLAFSICDNFDGALHSLGNIFTEIESDLGIARTKTTLEDWADQGVLLLNALALTVPAGKAKGHAKLGWKILVQQMLDRLSDSPRAYLLWGGPAQDVAKSVDPETNLKVETPHPSPLSVYRGFYGSRPFSRVNTWLQAQGKQAIHWGDPEGL